jgi:hypothetical protein
VRLYKRLGLIDVSLCKQSMALYKIGWCPMPESNRHSRRNAILNRARLPVPPMGHVGHCS